MAPSLNQVLTDFLQMQARRGEVLTITQRILLYEFMQHWCLFEALEEEGARRRRVASPSGAAA